MELALTGETITADRGAELGLVNRLADPGKALDVALELAAEVAANAPLATAASKTILNQQGSWDDETFWAKQGEIVAPVFTSEDAIEGATAFSEKRAPNWRGR
jgi:enoyl-CoA hydratase